MNGKKYFHNDKSKYYLNKKTYIKIINMPQFPIKLKQLGILYLFHKIVMKK